MASTCQIVMARAGVQEVSPTSIFTSGQRSSLGDVAGDALPIGMHTSRFWNRYTTMKKAASSSFMPPWQVSRYDRPHYAADGVHGVAGIS